MAELLWQDIRMAVRRLARSPGFSAIAIVTLALGIGVNSAIFSLVDAVLLRRLPFADQDRLVSVYEQRNGHGRDNVSGHEYAAWLEANDVLQSVAMYRGATFTLTGRGDATNVGALRASANLFETFGVRPAIGRGFLAGEDRGGQHVAVLGHAFWERRFDADSAIVGGTIILDKMDYRVVGVMSPAGEFDPDLWIAADLNEEIQAVGRHALTVVGRLRPGITRERAESELNLISARLERQLPRQNAGHRAVVVPVYEDVVGDARGTVLIVLGAVGFVLLIACANVAHLLLTRAVGRRREIAVRAAMGASRFSLVSQMLTESVLLSLAGGALGLVLAMWIVAILPTVQAVHIPRLAEVRLDGMAIAATFALALLTGVGSGLMPALRASRISVTEWLAAGARGSDGSGQRLADALVVTEVALVLVLLVGAGLMLRSFARLIDVRPGFNSHNVLVVSADLAGPRYAAPSSQRDAYDEISRRIASLPGVLAVGGTTETPLAMCCNGVDIAIEGRPDPVAGQPPHPLMRTITGDYFRVLGIPLEGGRLFQPSDARVSLPLVRWWPGQPQPARFDEPQAGPVAVVNEAMAREYWPDGHAVGGRFKIIASPWITVIGIVGDVRHRGLAAATTPEFFLAESQEPASRIALMIRTSGDPLALAASVRGDLRDFDRDIAVSSVTSMDAIVHDSVGRPRFNAFALGSFAALALTLALVGIYGVTSHAVAQRTREIGIRAALGASAIDVMRLVLGRAIALTGVGVVLGLVAAFGLSRLLTTLLFGIAPTDPMTFGGIAGALVAASLLASYIPARRALTVEPQIALRNE